jgi:transcriptional regulator with XRE-family HTH domain
MRHEPDITVSAAHPVVRRLTEIRIGWNLTTEYMAEKIGCSATTVNHMESGRRDPGFKVLMRWAESLGYDVALKPKGR